MKLNSDISAVITGGASGLGAATARLLASHGVKVAIFDMNEAVGQALASELGGVYCNVDVMSEEQVDTAFAKARADNIAWLDAVLADADFAKAYAHPKFGPLQAGMLLASWAAHDALHVRQIARRLHGLAARDAGAFGVAYAGEW